jgi:acetyl/propionyl-CoA carboxylase alpha subunit
VRLEARLRNRSRLIQLSREEGRYLGRIDDQEVDAEVFERGEGALMVRLAGRSFDISYWREGGEIHLDLGGPPLAVEILDPLLGSSDGVGKGAVAGRREVRAAMPGKVVAVKVKPGQEVRQGQGLVVVEAMKMENEVSSPRSGIVAALEVAPGQTVEKGALLFSIE